MAEKEQELTIEQRDAVAFMTLVSTYQQIAWVALGKIANPATNKIERDLEQARWAIDMLGMLERRTKGNLSEGESRMLRETLYTLRMNYVEEANRPPEKAATPEPSQETASSTGTPPETAKEERS